MLVDFFYHLRSQKLLVSVKEYLTLLQALSSPIMPPTLEDFYYLARTTLIKDETLFDRFDRAFASYYRSLEQKLPAGKKIPLDWLVAELEKRLTPEQKAELEKHGWDKLMEMFKERLEEQKGRHQGGTNGLVPEAPRLLAIVARIPRVFASEARAAVALPSRSGMSATSKTTTTPSNSARVISRLP